MAHWGTCGMPSCIGGWAISLFAGIPISWKTIGPEDIIARPEDIIAQEMLGLTSAQAKKLFYYWGDNSDDREVAVEVLRRLVRTKRVAWRAAQATVDERRQQEKTT